MNREAESGTETHTQREEGRETAEGGRGTEVKRGRETHTEEGKERGKEREGEGEAITITDVFWLTATLMCLCVRAGYCPHVHWLLCGYSSAYQLRREQSYGRRDGVFLADTHQRHCTNVAWPTFPW